MGIIYRLELKIYFHCRQIPDTLLALYAHSLYNDMAESRGNCDRPKVCLNLAKKIMSDVASEIYLSTFSDSRINALSSEVRKIKV